MTPSGRSDSEPRVGETWGLLTGAGSPSIVLAITDVVGVVLERPDGTLCEVGAGYFADHYRRRLDVEETLRVLQLEIEDAERAVTRAWERLEALRRRLEVVA